MASDPRQNQVPAVASAIAILRTIVAHGQPLGATQIARDAGLNVSTVFNILRTLAGEGLLSFDAAAKTYEIGMGMLEFVTPILGANPRDLLRPMLRDIAERHQVMLALWQITPNARIVLIDRITAPRIVQAMIAPDLRLPAFAGAMGRCYAAALNLSEADTRKGYDSVRWQSPPGFDAYWRDVDAARGAGVSFDHGNLFRGLEFVATLVRDAHGMPRIGLNSITIAGQLSADALQEVARSLHEAAGQIEKMIFGRRTPVPCPLSPAS